MTSQRFAAQIVVQYVNQPRGNAISGNVKDTAGKQWGVPQPHLWRFQPGGTYDILYWQKAGREGRVFNNVVAVNGEELGDGAGGRQAPQAMPAQQAQAQQAQAPLPQQQPIQRPLASQAPPPPAVSSHDREMYMFITGIVGRSMGSGKFEHNEIKLLTLAASDAWKALHAAPEPARPQANSEEPPPWPEDDPMAGYDQL